MQSESSLEINALLTRLQAETVNQGGMFCWVEIANPQRLSAFDCLYDLLERIAKASFEKADPPQKWHHFNPNDEYKKLQINPWQGGWEMVWERGLFWCQFVSLFYTHPEITRAFWPLWEAFQVLVMNKVEQSGLVAMHVAEDNGALYTLCGDHGSEDILFETDERLYILHFGISS